MTLSPGTTIGRYEVQSQLGAGGMGEVYLARDSQLDRLVALKILPPTIAGDHQRFHRFLQEAKAASALSHPNVAHIYEIGEAMLPDGTGHFISMEFIEGQSLESKIDNRPLHNSDLVDIAIQIADALDEAHAKGITHRDIKSSNIMITPRGRVKVLDFGLAKIASTQTITEPSDSEVATRVKTSPGVVMGTVQYMSPEQALGRDVDHRSDIFSFGVVLYHMATGRLPFPGETVTETIDRITHMQPDAIARFNYDIPPTLEVIIKKALRKDREERYQSIHDMMVDLREVASELDASERLERSASPSSSRQLQSSGQNSPATNPESTLTIPAQPLQTVSSAEYIAKEVRRHQTRFVITALAIILVVAGAGFGLYRYVKDRKPEIATTSKVVLSPNMKISRLTSNGLAQEAAISPDGKWVVYEQKHEDGKQSLWIRQIATNSIIQILPPSDVHLFRETFSPDGNYVFYQAKEQNVPSGALFQVPSLGGPVRKVINNVASPITFSPDGKRIAFFRSDVANTGEDQLVTANVDGSDERKLTARKVDKFFNYGGPAWSPDGKMIACSAGSYSGGLHLFVMVVDAQTGEQIEFSKQRFSDSGRIAWLSDGSALVVNAAAEDSVFDQLWLIYYPSGEAVKITNDLTKYEGPTLTSDSKTLATVQGDATFNIWVAPLNNLDTGRQITNGKFEGMGGVAWTPDNRIVYTTNTSGTNDISIINQDGSQPRLLTNDAQADESPFVSPDGRYVVFTALRGGFPSLWRMNIDGSELKQLTQGQEDYLPRISPDGQWILFQSWRSGRQTLWKISIDGGQAIQVLEKFSTSGSFSPDGKWIACFIRSEKPEDPLQMAVLPVAGGAPVKTFNLGPSAAEYINVEWTPDSKSLLYVDSRSGHQNLWSQGLDGGAPKQLTNFKNENLNYYAISRDGKTVVMSRYVVRTDVVLIRDLF